MNNGDRQMCPSEIREMYDMNPNMTVAQLARMAGITVNQVKSILMQSASCPF
jgi:plasmid maintenance system antidote protein VapI